MYCEKCGGELRQEENKLICTKCGAEYAQEIYSENSVPEEGGVYVTPRGFSSKKHIIAIIIAAIVAVVTVTVVVVNLPKPEQSTYMGGGIEVAERFLWEQKYEQAVIEFEKILEIEPMNVDAYLGLAEAYIGLGEKEKALEILRKGLELTGDERLQAKIDELTKPAETSSSSSTTSEPSEPKVPVYNDAECLQIEEMILAYLRGEGEIDSSKLKDVTSLRILGIDVVSVYCGYRYGTLVGAYSYGNDTFDFRSTDYNYGNIDSIQEDLPFIFEMPSLKELWVDFNQISDVASLAGLTNLTRLDLCGNQISDITPLAGLANLTNLSLDFNQISDLTPLAGLTKLETLWLHYNQINDLTPLAGLTNLTNLHLSWQCIECEGIWGKGTDFLSDITPLSSLTNLTYLSLYWNKISDITPLAGLTNLTSLDLRNNEIRDITPLAGLTNLTYLLLTGNSIGPAYDEEWLQTQLPNCDIS